MTRIDGVPAEIEIEDGRIMVTAQGDARVYAKAPEPEPLSRSEPSLRIHLSGEEFGCEFRLDAEQLDDLATAIEEARRR